MKTLLKSLFVAIAILISIPSAANTDGGKAISPSRLPKAATQTISSHLPGRKIAIAKVESGLFSKSYTVIFTNGEKIEFDGQGRWTEVKCKRSSVPASLVPAPIAQYVRTHYPNCRILEIERDDEYEVKLSNYVEITFNKKFEVIDID